MGRMIFRSLAVSLLCVAFAPAVLGLTPADIFARVRPAVVTIVTHDADGKELAQGSGFIAKSDGAIVTCFHVISGASKVKVIRHNGASWTAQGLIAWDEAQDIAVLKVSGKDLPTISLGDSDKVRQGDKILAIGSPLGLEQTASDGIVSALRGATGTPKLLQISASVSPGSSGGPILNLEGQVLGIASFVLIEGQDLNFAVPVNSIKPKLARGGKVTPFKDAKQGVGNIAQELAKSIMALPVDETSPDAPKKYEATLKLLQKLVEERKDCAVAYFYLARCLFGLGRYLEAVDSYKEAIRLEPDDAHAHLNLGLAYYCLGRYQDAVDSCKEAIRIKPDLAEAHGQLGMACFSLGRYQDAVDSCKEAIRIKPDLAEAHCQLGMAYALQKRYQDAVDSLKYAIRIKPDFAEAHYRLGMEYALQKRCQDAVDSLKYAIRIKPDYTDAHFMLGETYLMFDDRGSALDEYKILKTLDADKAAQLFKNIYP